MEKAGVIPKKVLATISELEGSPAEYMGFGTKLIIQSPLPSRKLSFLGTL
jgi:hypothetical protein